MVVSSLGFVLYELAIFSNLLARSLISCGVMALTLRCVSRTRDMLVVFEWLMICLMASDEQLNWHLLRIVPILIAIMMVLAYTLLLSGDTITAYITLLRTL